MSEREAFNIKRDELYPVTAGEEPTIHEFDADMEEQMRGEVRRRFDLPNLPRSQWPYLGWLEAANRSSTGAFAVAFGNLGITSHIQAIKSARRDVWQRKYTGKGIVCKNETVVINDRTIGHLLKEALGMRRQCDYLFEPPHESLESIGYPQEKLFGITLWRHPLHMAESCGRRGDWQPGNDPELINLAYRLTYQSMLEARQRGIPVIPVAIELMLTQDGPEILMRSLIQELNKERPGFEITYHPNAIDWTNARDYETAVVHYQLPPDEYVLGTVRRLHNDTNGRFGLGYKPYKRVEMSWPIGQQDWVLPQLAEAVEIYEAALAQSRDMLGLYHEIPDPLAITD